MPRLYSFSPYNDDMHVYGYEWWENKEEGISCGLDVLVVDDWLKD